MVLVEELRGIKLEEPCPRINLAFLPGFQGLPKPGHQCIDTPHNDATSALSRLMDMGYRGVSHIIYSSRSFSSEAYSTTLPNM